MFFVVVACLIMSEIGAYTGWKNLKAIGCYKDDAHFYYRLHLLSYLMMGGYIYNYSFFSIDGQYHSFGQLGIIVIAIVNYLPALYLNLNLHKYFKIEKGKYVLREV